VLTGLLAGLFAGLAVAAVLTWVRRRRPRAVLSRTTVPLVEVDQRGVIRRASPPFLELVGGISLPSRLTDLVHPDDLAAFVAGGLGDLRLGNPVRASVRLLHLDAGVRHVELLAEASRARTRRLLVVDVTEDEDLALRRRQGDSRSRLDELTGLPNRSSLADHLTCALRDGRRGSRPVVLFVELEDLDGLEPADHDLVVLEASRRLAATARGLDHVSRFGDRQFVVIAAGVDDNDGALSAAHRIGQALEGAVVLEDASAVGVRASIGIAHPWAEDSALNVIRRAQQALDRARGTAVDGGAA
jgi:diguanylate cyclase (GGDEF)-like protein